MFHIDLSLLFVRMAWPGLFLSKESFFLLLREPLLLNLNYRDLVVSHPQIPTFSEGSQRSLTEEKKKHRGILTVNWQEMFINNKKKGYSPYPFYSSVHKILPNSILINRIQF